MQDYIIQNTSGELQGIVKTDLGKLKKVNEMYKAIEEIVKRYLLSPWITKNCKKIIEEI